jgi:hypothetical protein
MGYEAYVVPSCSDFATDDRLQWAPLRIKLAVNSVLQHLGGVHSGCALSGAA